MFRPAFRTLPRRCDSFSAAEFESAGQAFCGLDDNGFPSPYAFLNMFEMIVHVLFPYSNNLGQVAGGVPAGFQ